MAHAVQQRNDWPGAVVFTRSVRNDYVKLNSYRLVLDGIIYGLLIVSDGRDIFKHYYYMVVMSGGLSTDSLLPVCTEWALLWCLLHRWSYTLWRSVLKRHSRVFRLI